jgi:hypothetical protein
VVCLVTWIIALILAAMAGALLLVFAEEVAS